MPRAPLLSLQLEGNIEVYIKHMFFGPLWKEGGSKRWLFFEIEGVKQDIGSLKEDGWKTVITKNILWGLGISNLAYNDLPSRIKKTLCVFVF